MYHRFGYTKQFCSLALSSAAALLALSFTPTSARSDAAQESAELDLTQSIHALIQTLAAHGLHLDAEATRETLLDTVIKLADPEGGLLTPERQEQMGRRQRGLIYDPGLQANRTNELAYISEIRPGSPAADAGLREGQHLLEIDDIDVTTGSLFRICQLVRNNKQTPLSLRFRADDGTTNRVQVARVPYELPGIERADPWPGAVGYLRVNTIRAGVGAEIIQQLKQWKEAGMYGVVLDLRRADGADLDSVRDIASLFSDEGDLLFAFQDQDGHELSRYTASPSSQAMLFPIMALVDETTGGAAELLAATLKGSTRGTMSFGRPTRGDMLVREAIPLGDYTMYLATRKLVTGDGTIYDGSSGIQPDVIVTRTDWQAPEITSRRHAGKDLSEEEELQQQLNKIIRGDATLRRAVDVLLGLKALDRRMQR